MARAQWFNTLEAAKKGAKGRPVHSVRYGKHGICYFAGEPPTYVQREVVKGKAKLQRYMQVEGKWVKG